MLVALALVGCNARVETPSPASSTPSPQVSVAPTAAPTSTTVPTVTPAPTPVSAWVAGAPLHQGRQDHTATLLKDGRLLVAGGTQYVISPEGEDQNQDLSSVEILTYYPDSAFRYKWEAAPPMPDARSGHDAILLQDGRVLVFGGSTFDAVVGYAPVTTAAVFDPQRNRWKAIAGPPIATPTGGLLLPDGRVLTVGLTSKGTPRGQSVAIFDPTTLSWSRGPNHPGGAYRPAMTLLVDGSVLVAGGWYPTAELPSPVVDSWRYVVTSDRWERTTDILEPAFGGPPVRLADGSVLLVSEQTSNVFDPVASRWTMAAAPLRYLMFPNVVGLSDGRVLVTGQAACGIDGDATEIYDPVTDRWQLVEVVPERSDATLTVLSDGQVALVGGVLECNVPGEPFVALRDFDILNPAKIR